SLGNGLHSVGGVQGLKIQVSSSDARSWILRAKINDKVRDIGLGSYPTISLKAAREHAQKLWEQIKLGLDPLVEKQKLKDAQAAARRSRKTFQECATDYIAQVIGKEVGSKSVQQWTNTLNTYAIPVIGQLAVSGISKVHIIQVLEPIWESKHETASRLRGRIERILNYAKARGYRDGDNPAAFKGNLESALPSFKRKAQEHHPGLPYAETAEFIANLKQQNGIASKALYFVILTAARSGEVRGADWAEIDLINKTWTIPATRMKAGKEHVIPLANEAIDLLKQLGAQSSGLVFKSQRGKALSDAALAKVIKDMHERKIKIDGLGWVDPDANNRVATPHGFRSTFRVWAADNTNFPAEIVEHALAHKLKDRVEAAYQRKSALPKRIALMNQWSEFCHNTTKNGVVLKLKK
ncbi:tyrosine-type recombinase/integrase, partial [Litoricolaceae bacterium]|nr:tyrosine-type recombinase/integrase [Litorivicinaceae bacterium]